MKTLNRRLMLSGGAAIGAGLILGANPAHAGSLKDAIFEKARQLSAENQSRINFLDRMALVDFSLPSWKPRFHLVDLVRGDLSSYLVAHGRGSDPKHSGWLQRFSNEIGSNATSQGVYRTGSVYHGKYGKAMRLTGLDAENSNARMRAIVIHAAWYAGQEMIAKYGKLGRSEGCFAFSEADRDKVVSTLGEGRLLYAGKI